MVDLLIRNANLPDGRSGIDVAVRDGRIVAVEHGLQAEAAETLDASACLLSPPFVDAHFHMDATLSYGLPRVNQSGTLLEGIALWGELKPAVKSLPATGSVCTVGSANRVSIQFNSYRELASSATK